MTGSLLCWKTIEHSAIFNLVPKHPNRTSIGTCWVCRNKLDNQGHITRRKNILVGQGYNTEKEMDYNETFDPIS